MKIKTLTARAVAATFHCSTFHTGSAPMAARSWSAAVGDWRWAFPVALSGWTVRVIASNGIDRRLLGRPCLVRMTLSSAKSRERYVLTSVGRHREVFDLILITSRRTSSAMENRNFDRPHSLSLKTIGNSVNLAPVA